MIIILANWILSSITFYHSYLLSAAFFDFVNSLKDSLAAVVLYFLMTQLFGDLFHLGDDRQMIGTAFFTPPTSDAVRRAGFFLVVTQSGPLLQLVAMNVTVHQPDDRNVDVDGTGQTVTTTSTELVA